MAESLWPVDAGDDPPRGHLYASAVWLVVRHPVLAELLRGVPEVVGVDEDGLSLDLEALTEAIGEFDAHVAGRAAWERKHREPSDYGDRGTAGTGGGRRGMRRRRRRVRRARGRSGRCRPRSGPGSGCWGCSPPVERRCGPRRWGLLDQAGRALADWCRALQAA